MSSTQIVHNSFGSPTIHNKPHNSLGSLTSKPKINCLCGSKIQQSSLKNHQKSQKHLAYLAKLNSTVQILKSSCTDHLSQLDHNLLESIVFRLNSNHNKMLHQTSRYLSGVVRDYTGCVDHSKIINMLETTNFDNYPTNVKKCMIGMCVYAIAIGGNKWRAVEILNCLSKSICMHPPKINNCIGVVTGNDGMDYYIHKNMYNTWTRMPLWTFPDISSVYKFMLTNKFNDSMSQTAVSESMKNVLGISVMIDKNEIINRLRELATRN